MDIRYIAIFPHQNDTLNYSFLETLPNSLREIIPLAGKWEKVVRVIDLVALRNRFEVKLHANPLDQKAICYLERK